MKLCIHVICFFCLLALLILLHFVCGCCLVIDSFVTHWMCGGEGKKHIFALLYLPTDAMCMQNEMDGDSETVLIALKYNLNRFTVATLTFLHVTKHWTKHMDHIETTNIIWWCERRRVSKLYDGGKQLCYGARVMIMHLFNAWNSCPQKKNYYTYTIM